MKQREQLPAFLSLAILLLLTLSVCLRPLRTQQNKLLGFPCGPGLTIQKIYSLTFHSWLVRGPSGIFLQPPPEALEPGVAFMAKSRQ